MPPTRNAIARQLFSPEELEILIKACVKHRRTIPAYLQASQPELAIIDEVLRVLSEPPPTALP